MIEIISGAKIKGIFKNPDLIGTDITSKHDLTHFLVLRKSYYTRYTQDSLVLLEHQFGLIL